MQDDIQNLNWIETYCPSKQHRDHQIRRLEYLWIIFSVSQKPWKGAKEVRFVWQNISKYDFIFVYNMGHSNSRLWHLLFISSLAQATESKNFLKFDPVSLCQSLDLWWDNSSTISWHWSNLSVLFVLSEVVVWHLRLWREKQAPEVSLIWSVYT